LFNGITTTNFNPKKCLCTKKQNNESIMCS
jgi:hypothetical protein